MSEWICSSSHLSDATSFNVLKQGIAFLISFGLLTHPVQSLGFKFLNFNLHAVVVGLTFLVKFGLSEADTLLTLTEPVEEVGEYGH